MKKLKNTLRPLVVILALAVAVALIAATAGRTALRLDFTARHIATPTEEALGVVRAVGEPVRLYLVVSDEGGDTLLSELMARFAAANANISYEAVAVSSNRMSALTPLANGAELAEGSVVVASDRRSVALTADDLYHYEIDQMTYYYSNGQTINYTAADFNAQNALCNAIAYVTRGDMPVLYALSGHGENGWDSQLYSFCFHNGIALETLTLDAGQAVPDDAAAVLVCSPASPVGDGTADALLAYLQAGGDMLLMTNYSTDFTGLDRVAAHYGMARKAGLVLDNDARHILSADYKPYLRPDMRANPCTDALIEAGQIVVMPVSEAIARSDVRRAGLNAQPILLTSDQAYLKANTDALATLDQESADEAGRFILGMAAVDGDTHLTWLASASVLTVNACSASGGGNDALIAAILGQMFDFAPQDAGIPGVSMLTRPAALPVVPALACLAALPLICLIVGLILRRRRA